MTKNNTATSSLKQTITLLIFFNISTDFIHVLQVDGYFRRINPAVSDIGSFTDER
jgi:hypothetical protein